jgi:hypothetical protein
LMADQKAGPKDMMKVVHLVGYLAEHWVDPWEHQMVDCWAVLGCTRL